MVLFSQRISVPQILDYYSRLIKQYCIGQYCLAILLMRKMSRLSFLWTFTIFPILGFVKVSQGQVCDSASYVLINDPERSIGAVYDGAVNICDGNLIEGLWYRFQSYVGDRIPERAVTAVVERNRCGALTPVYIAGIGSHPTTDGETKNASICRSESTLPDTAPSCQPFGTILIHKCPGRGKDPSYFIYKLKNSGGCDYAYCAGERVPCNRTDSWNGSACVPTQDPCVNYEFINMADGFRSSDFNSRHSNVAICDAYEDPEKWYRFEHESGDQLKEDWTEPWYCGTQAPIWLKVSHPTDSREKVVQACASFDGQHGCSWSGFVRIRWCNKYGEKYYVYRLAVPPGCPLAYCVDASSRKTCSQDEVWNAEKFRCEVPTIASTISPGTKTTPTTPPSAPVNVTGWSSWESWSKCSKECDYGLQTRRRVCGQFSLPCDGPSTATRSCIESDCKKIPEEEAEGIILTLASTVENETALSVVLRNEEIIYEMIRSSLNKLCSANVSLCCGTSYTGLVSHDFEYVAVGGVYRAQGGLKNTSITDVSIQIIGVLNEKAYQDVCTGGSDKISAKRKRSIFQAFLSFLTMLSSVLDVVGKIKEVTGLEVTGSSDPESKSEPSGGGNDCPMSTCVVPLVTTILNFIIAIPITIKCYRKYQNRGSESCWRSLACKLECKEEEKEEEKGDDEKKKEESNGASEKLLPSSGDSAKKKEIEMETISSQKPPPSLIHVEKSKAPAKDVEKGKKTTEVTQPSPPPKSKNETDAPLLNPMVKPKEPSYLKTTTDIKVFHTNSPKTRNRDNYGAQTMEYTYTRTTKHTNTYQRI